jgi:hypothetical protein
MTIKLKSLDRLETHDRLLELKKEADYISKGCEDCVKSRPPEFGNHPLYIFAHKREIGTDERMSIFQDDFQRSMFDPGYVRRYHSLENVPSSRLIWSPRLTKPEAQVNSMLFKAYPPTDIIKVIWMIPAYELWGQYTEGKLAENKAVSESIYEFRNNKNKLEAKEEDDLTDSQINAIYNEISRNRQGKK